eukprot:gnl/TRDRNA2_/TRDRNA2_80792_c0_seq1.p1 gnl/TRDRNA2_/TRDRNA2_80792_c0~~gnl/TRDRNA2_/TRDRNA2_80792_c0_seq1.p1  ORF type:complete len:421 (-),score=88.64 gnl/TRDRNA2_/TRDRNA2_80792_c0_seq1:339-1601(-)
MKHAKAVMSLFIATCTAVLGIVVKLDLIWFLRHPAVSLLIGAIALEGAKEAVLLIMEHIAENSESKLDDVLVDSIAAELRCPSTRILFVMLSFWGSSYIIDASLEVFLTECGFLWADQAIRPSLQVFKFAASCLGVLRATDCASRMAKRAIKQLEGHSEDKGLDSTPLVLIARYASLFTGGSVLALTWGFDVKTALSAAGVVSLGIAMSLKEVFENFFDLIILTFDCPYHVGSCVCIGGTWGTVESIGFRNTRLRSADGLLHIIPHNTIRNAQVTNNSADQVDTQKASFTIELAWTTTTAQLEGLPQMLTKAVESKEGHHVKFARLNKLTDHGYEFIVAFVVDGVLWPAGNASEALMRCLVVIKKAGIELAQEKRLELANWQAQQYAAAALPGAQGYKAGGKRVALDDDNGSNKAPKIDG